MGQFLNIKPVSVNEVWQGKRFKTRAYSKYINDMLRILPPLNVPNGHLALTVTFGFSSLNADIDNPLKPFIDCLQRKYKFNDRMITKLVVTKEVVKKGSEFIDFELVPVSTDE